MNRIALVLPLCVFCLVGCTGLRPSITEVQSQLGPPDVISDRSGDQERFYRPDDRPADEWPADAPRTFYYLRHNVAVTFISGREVSRSKIPQALKGPLRRVIERSGWDARRGT